MACDIATLAFDAVDSTMLEAARQADAGVRGPLLIWARAQTGGRGRHGRVWSSPPGNLYWTMLLHAEAGRPRDAGLSFASGLAVIDALTAQGVAPARLALKWPNDALLDGRKVAGLLVQAEIVAGSATRLVVGIGLNVATFPPEATFPATSLAASGLASIGLEALRDSLTHCFMARFAHWQANGIPGLRADLARRLHGVGGPIRIALDRDRQAVVEGTNEGIDARGALLLRTPDGTLRTIVAGDVLA